MTFLKLHLATTTNLICELCSVRKCMNNLIVNVALEALYIYTKKVEVMG